MHNQSLTEQFYFTAALLWVNL